MSSLKGQYVLPQKTTILPADDDKASWERRYALRTFSRGRRYAFPGATIFHRRRGMGVPSTDGRHVCGPTDGAGFPGATI